jgi:cytochrome c553
MNRWIYALSSLAVMASMTVNAAAERAEELTDTALDLDGNAQRGAVLYGAQCVSCHGAQGFGDAKRGIPVLAGQRRAYVIKQLADFIEGEREATQMHNVVKRSEVSDPQAWADLALYLNSLPSPKSAQTGDGKYLSLGEASFEQGCVTCHEDDGRGDDDGFVPSLRNQHYGYLLKEMRSLAQGHRFASEPELGRFLSSLDADEVQGLADYISRMRGPVRDRVRLNHDGSVSD